jgi:hypothetical protein
MALAHVLGVPRIGPNRELKFAQESFWRGEIDEASLKAVASGIHPPGQLATATCGGAGFRHRG